MNSLSVETSANFFNDVQKGFFLGRPNRFIVECTVDDRPVRAYLPNPGRLWELLFPGSVLYLVKHDASHAGSTDYMVVAVEREGLPIMLHTHVNNLVARQLIEQGKILGLEGSAIVRPEVTIGNSRFDFLIRNKGKDIVVEVKSCTLVGQRIAMFPDALTARGTRHVQELAELSQAGTKTAVIFIVHWPRAEYFMPEHHTDLEFSRTLLAVKDDVMVRALSVEWNKDLTLGDRVRDLKIPWDIVEKEALDRGSYIVILRLNRDRRFSIGGLGNVRLRKGYYLYVGSAKANLGKRIERHQRLRKNLFWHVDYLRAAADFHAALPVRASEDLECDIAATLRKIADWDVPGFGSSDCDCESHLFGMSEEPVHAPEFIKMLQYFRMDRLEKFLRIKKEV
jgi:sugar fermentation stimulation protein A